MSKLKTVWQFYIDGFRSMTWGRTLWLLILLKLFLLFVVLRLFFFHPVLEGKDAAQSSQFVGEKLIEKGQVEK